MNNSVPFCPVCSKESSSFLNLSRHMVMSDRPNGPHQQWLKSFLNAEFSQYAFKHDSDVAKAIKAYYKKYNNLPDY